ncbi:MAG: hypothetical protein JST38_05290 [Bacteroidetes bacterium]|nr:hypothetical protein [Bacteroidota bacterium]MBS1940272.1 hypothetical protein [Bacteroidota bacterium]
MKTIQLSLALTLGFLLLIGQAHAASDDAPTMAITNSRAMERAVMHQINHHMIFPLDAEEGTMCGTVDVAFAVDVNGHLVVKEARSENSELRDYVVRKLAKVRVGANPSGLWNTTHVRFTFKPEQPAL